MSRLTTQRSSAKGGSYYMHCGAEISVKNTRIRFSFGFFAVWSLIIISCTYCGGSGSSGAQLAQYAAASCLLHEAGHIIAMQLFGIKIRHITFYSGGISVKSSPPLECTGSFVEAAVLAAGSAFNLIIAAAAYIAGSRLLMLTDLSLALFNLLPFSALDGGRLLRLAAITVNPGADIDSAQKICDLVLGIAAAAFFIHRGSVSFTLPLTLAMIILEGLWEK